VSFGAAVVLARALGVEVPHYLPHGLRQQGVGPHPRHHARQGSEGNGVYGTLSALLGIGDRDVPFMAFHAEASPITLVGDEFLGLYACSDPSCIKDDLSLLVLELDEKVVAGFRCGIHCKVQVVRLEWV
jgi:hypothetical protein